MDKQNKRPVEIIISSDEEEMISKVDEIIIISESEERQNDIILSDDDEMILISSSSEQDMEYHPNLMDDLPSPFGLSSSPQQRPNPQSEDSFVIQHTPENSSGNSFYIDNSSDEQPEDSFVIQHSDSQDGDEQSSSPSVQQILPRRIPRRMHWFAMRRRNNPFVVIEPEDSYSDFVLPPRQVAVQVSEEELRPTVRQCAVQFPEEAQGLAPRKSHQ